MEKIGSGLPKLDKYLEYLVRVGTKMGETIRLERRPRPNTDPTDQEIELSHDALKWYDSQFEKRQSLAEEAKASHGETSFSLGDLLRVTWA